MKGNTSRGRGQGVPMSDDNNPVIAVLLIATIAVVVLVLIPPGMLDPRPDVENPVADAGPDVTIELGTAYTLDGSRSTDDKAIDQYLWSVDYAPNTFVFHGERATFVFDRTGTFEVVLTVTDTVGNESADTMRVTVI